MVAVAGGIGKPALGEAAGAWTPAPLRGLGLAFLRSLLGIWQRKFVESGNLTSHGILMGFQCEYDTS